VRREGAGWACSGLGLRVVQRQVPLAEGAPDRCPDPTVAADAIDQQRSKGQLLGVTPVDARPAIQRLEAALQLPCELGLTVNPSGTLSSSALISCSALSETAVSRLDRRSPRGGDAVGSSPGRCPSTRLELFLDIGQLRVALIRHPGGLVRREDAFLDSWPAYSSRTGDGCRCADT